MKRSKPVTSQRGAVLMFALLLCALLATASSIGLEVASLELRMVANEEYQLSSSQLAQGILDELQARPGNFPLSSQPGDVVCGFHATTGDCSHATPGFADRWRDWPGEVDYWIERRKSVLLSEPPLPVEPGAFANSQSLNAAIFEVTVEVGGESSGPVPHRLISGVAVLPGSQGQSGAGTVSEVQIYQVYWREPAGDPL